MNEIEDIKSYARRNDVPIMKDEGIDFICDFIKTQGCKKILEIGSAIGYSAIRFAECGADITVTTIEIDIDRYSKAVQNISDCGLSDRIEIRCEDALKSKIDGKYDLIFIDAAKAQYIKFFEKYKANLSDGGVILSDNLSFHGMVEDPSLTSNYSTIKLLRKIQKYISFLKSNPEFTTDFFELGDGVSVSRLNPNPAKVGFEKLQKGDEAGLKRMSNLATEIVREHFDPIIGKEMNDFMLEKFQTADAIKQMMHDGMQYYFVTEFKDEARCEYEADSRIKADSWGEAVSQGDRLSESSESDASDLSPKVIGFMAFFGRDGEMTLSKFYLKKEYRGCGLSKPMLRFVVKNCEERHLHSISLHVNRNNPAVEAYKKIGFVISGEEKTDIGNGFVMDDYTMLFRV